MIIRNNDDPGVQAFLNNIRNTVLDHVDKYNRGIYAGREPKAIPTTLTVCVNHFILWLIIFVVMWLFTRSERYFVMVVASFVIQCVIEINHELVEAGMEGAEAIYTNPFRVGVLDAARGVQPLNATRLLESTFFVQLREHTVHDTAFQRRKHLLSHEDVERHMVIEAIRELKASTVLQSILKEVTIQ